MCDLRFSPSKATKPLLDWFWSELSADHKAKAWICQNGQLTGNLGVAQLAEVVSRVEIESVAVERGRVAESLEAHPAREFACNRIG